MQSKGKKILFDFIADERISEKDQKQLHVWLSESDEVEELFREEWEKGDTMETEIRFSDVQKKISQSNEPVTTLFKKIILNYQKVAAIFLLPFIAVSLYFSVQQLDVETTWFQTSALRGQKSQVVLPDGTKVWLNSDSQISYPDNFGRKNRRVQLRGEAYFEVSSDAKNPFFVEAGEAQVRVVGTTFNLKAYPDENEIETTLFEGKVELTIHPENKNIAARTVKMQHGESLVFNKTKNELKYGRFESEEILAWTNNQLIFKNVNFENLVRKIERWFDVEIVYDEARLNKQRLTVELHQGELLFRLLDIIEFAMDVECISEKDKIYIKAKQE